MLDSAGSSSLSIIFWPRDPEQAARWTWLVVIASTILRLAKPLVRNRRLPWERPRPPYRLTLYRLRRAVSALLPGLGTPQTRQNPAGARRDAPRPPLRAGTAPPGHQAGRLAFPHAQCTPPRPWCMLGALLCVGNRRY